jgi:hypothetical protein
MRPVARRLLWCGLLVLILALMTSASLAPLMAEEVHLHLVPGETAVEYAPAVHSAMGIKKIVSQHRLLPMIALYLIFMIVSFGMTDESIRMLIRLHPGILLLRRKLLLLPLKFTSSYVNRPISSLTY